MEGTLEHSLGQIPFKSQPSPIHEEEVLRPSHLFLEFCFGVLVCACTCVFVIFMSKPEVDMGCFPQLLSTSDIQAASYPQTQSLLSQLFSPASLFWGSLVSTSCAPGSQAGLYLCLRI